MIKIPLVDLKRQYIKYKSEIDQAIEEVINETAFISGKYAKLFENEFSKKFNANDFSKINSIKTIKELLK